MYVAALDLGTSGCRTIIFDITGSIVSSHYEEWESYFPSPLMVEQSADQWYEKLKITIKNAIEKVSINPQEIVSISITNQRETIVPIDSEGNSLYNAIVWQDRRTTNECEIIKKKVGIDKIYKITGLTIDPYFSASKILWFKNNKQEIYNKTHKFLLVHDYILYKLTGQFYTDFSNASRTMLFDVNTLKWSDEIASLLGIDLDKMPTPVESGIDIGELTANDTSFDKKTLVITGAGDQQAAALGVGVVEPGRIKCTTGTGSFILAYLEEPQFDTKKRVLCSCHAVPGSWVQESSIFTTGAVFRWARDQIGFEEREKTESGKNTYDLMTKMAEGSPVGANGLIMIPHFTGAGAPYWNPYARGIFFGLTLGHTRADIYRAIMESVSFEVKKNIQVFNELNFSSKELRVTGGGSRSNLWNSIMADIVGIPVFRPELEEATALGAAILAASGAGIFPDIAKAANDICKISDKWYPNKENNRIYESIFNFYNIFYSNLENSNIYRKFFDLNLYKKKEEENQE
ncbi:MAG: xylulokinase [Candidatus Lokiarchaeota archaeon]|nr:xylulokinase [Candidatus Lokiarchaeota archaeon]